MTRGTVIVGADQNWKLSWLLTRPSSFQSAITVSSREKSTHTGLPW
jgi:hypothetical protein